MRKILIGFASLGIVLGAYLLYLRMSGMPEIDPDRAAEAIQSIADGNATGPESDIGKIGDVGLGPVSQSYYATRNPKTQEIVREFGFEMLLHADRDLWVTRKPYMNVYRRNFKCYITADKGDIEVETAVGRTTPKNATFSSNVVIHIVPTGTGRIAETFVYLDNIIFLSDKSLLSSTGPVRVESEDARMRGTGLELIFNEQAERLEYFEIPNLESMSYRITNAQAALFSITQTSPQASPLSDVQEPNELSLAAVPDEKETTLTNAERPVEKQEGEYYRCILNDNVLIDTPEQLIFADKKLQIHDIFFSKAFIDQSDEVDADRVKKTEPIHPAFEPDPQSEQSPAEPNVPVSVPIESTESPDEKPAFIVITCDGSLIIVPKDSTRVPGESIETGAPTTPSETERSNQLAAAVAARARQRLDDGTKRTKFFSYTMDYQAETGDMAADGLSELTYWTDTAMTEANAPRTPVKITAHEGATYSKASNQVVFTNCLCTMSQPGLTKQRDVTFLTPKITVDLPNEKSEQPNITAAGPVELAFYMEAKKKTTADRPQDTLRQGQITEVQPLSAAHGPLTPVTVNARQWAKYSAELKQMAFEGDCRCTMVREAPNVIEEYVLLSKRMTVDLAEDANDRTFGPAAGLEHLTAKGDIVHLAMTRMAKAGGAFAELVEDVNGIKLLGGVELKCQQFDYDAVQQLYWATGPGLIKLNNMIPADPNEPARPFSLRDPCWAIINGFDTLNYSLLTNRIVANAAPQEKLGIIYLPMANNKDAGEVSAEASEVDVFLRETDEGQSELATLKATGGIFYEDDRGHQFIGSELFYDHTTAIVKIKGDEVQPCYYNGILVDKITYHINDNKVEFNIVGPGAIQLDQ